MCVCMYVCVYVCMSVCVYVHIHSFSTQIAGKAYMEKTSSRQKKLLEKHIHTRNTFAHTADNLHLHVSHPRTCAENQVLSGLFDLGAKQGEALVDL
jgi:hypothetical protein